MRILVTGSADGLGRLAAAALLEDGHEVVVHVRSHERLSAVGELLTSGAGLVVGDLADLDQTRDVAEQANAIGRMDAVIHNAGVYSGRDVMPVNVVAPYVLTALMARPLRLIYITSGMQSDGRATIDHVDWAGTNGAGRYGQSKLFVTALSAAVARLWPDVISSSVNPGWVPTRMGGPGAPDDLGLGHLTQEWLATSDDPKALTSGGYWHHQRRSDPPAPAQDEHFQDQLLASLAAYTGAPLP